MSSSAMGRLLARRLLEAKRAGDERLSVAEVRRELLPYPLCRRELSLATKAEYDLALLDLLLDPSLLEPEEPAFETELRAERDSAEPGLGVLDGRDGFLLKPGGTLRTLVEKAVAGGGSGATSPGAPTVEPETAPEPAGGRATSVGPDVNPEAGRNVQQDREGSVCVACGRTLPEREGLLFCPFCGTDQSVRRCASCEEELEPGWRFCPSCGRRSDG